MLHCESAELHIRARGKDIVVPLSDTQIIIAATILGVCDGPIDVVRGNLAIKPVGAGCTSIEDFRRTKAQALEIVHPNHEVETQHAVYSSHVKVDILDVAPDGTCAVYCICHSTPGLKAGACYGSPRQAPA